MQGLSTHVAGRQILPLNFATTSLVKILDFNPFLALAPLNKVEYVLKKFINRMFLSKHIFCSVEHELSEKSTLMFIAKCKR